MAKTSSPSPVQRRRLLPRLRALGRDENGTTAIEFGLLAIPFFAIIGAILETALIFFSGQVLDAAVRDASRLVLTGQATSISAPDFKQAVCDRLYGLMNCTDLKVRVSTLNTFNEATSTSPIDPVNGKYKADWDQPVYQPGAPSAIIMVEAYYKAPVLINLGGFNMQNTPDGKRLLGAVRIFENEP